MTDFDLATALTNIPNSSSTKLADMVVAYRYLGLYKEASVAAMEELGKRRANGDHFDFEAHIDQQLNSLPKLEFKKKDLSSFFRVVNKMVGGTK